MKYILIILSPFILYLSCFILVAGIIAAAYVRKTITKTFWS